MSEFNKIFKFHFVKCQKNKYFYVKVSAETKRIQLNGHNIRDSIIHYGSRRINNLMIKKLLKNRSSYQCNYAINLPSVASTLLFIHFERSTSFPRFEASNVPTIEKLKVSFFASSSFLLTPSVSCGES